MRRSVNVLQSTSMATEVVNEEAVYTSTGNPLPAVVAEILTAMLNEDFGTAYAFVRNAMVEGGLALQDIVSAMHTWVTRLYIAKEIAIGILKKKNQRILFSCVILLSIFT